MILNILNIVIHLFLPTLQSEELKLKPFETDACTMFIDGPPGESPGLWKNCCIEHDLRYWFGGSQEDMNRADLKLRSCVQKLAGDTWAHLIYSGVRAGHYSPIKHRYFWGWAWMTKRKKSELTQAESKYVISELRQLTLQEVDIEEFIKSNFPNQKAL